MKKEEFMRAQLLLIMHGISVEDTKSEDTVRLMTNNLDSKFLDGLAEKLAAVQQQEYELNQKTISPLIKIAENGLKIDFDRAGQKYYNSRIEKRDDNDSELRLLGYKSKASIKETLKELRKKRPELKDAWSIGYLEKSKYANDSDIQLIIKKVKYDSQISYYESLKNQGEVINTNFHVFGTTSGGMISHSPSIQNISKEIKNCVVPNQAGDKVYELDLKSADVVALAALSGEEKIFDILSENRDIYRYIASKIFDKNEMEIKDNIRDFMKIIVNGTTYGMTPYSVSKKFNELDGTKRKMTENVGKKIQENYLSLFPRMSQYFNLLQKKRVVTSFLGYTLAKEPSKKNIALVAQNFVSTLMKRILITLQDKDLIENHVINQVHDSLWISGSQEVAERIKEVMESETRIMIEEVTKANYDQISFVKLEKLGEDE